MSSTKKDRYLGILIVLLGLYSGAFGTFLSVARRINIETRPTEASIISSVIGVVLVLIAMIFLFNIILILISLILEMKNILDARGDNKDPIIYFFRKKVLSSHLNFIFSNGAFGMVIILVTSTYTNIRISVILAILFWVIGGIIYSMQPYEKKIKKLFSKAQKNGFPWYWGVSITLVVSIFLFVILTGIISYSVSFEVEYSKDFFEKTEEPYVEIYPLGIVRPRVINVTYSNQNIPLDYVKHESYRASPIYTTIPIEILTDEPYNSFIKITYEILPWSPHIFIYGEKVEFVPVFPLETKVIYATR